MNSTKLKEGFIKKSKGKFGNKFIYTKVDYVNYHTKVIIVCTIHGDMELTPDAHIKSKYGCKQCAVELAHTTIAGETSPVKTTKQFIEDAIIVHGGRYLYTNTLYKNRLSPVAIICPIHGEFTLPQACRHLEGRGCKQCYIEAMFLSPEEYTDQANNKHKGFYDYSEMIYKGKKYDVDIICPLHGKFTLNAQKHVKGFGCKQCGGRSKR